MISYFLNLLIDLNYNWYDEKWWSEILFSIYSTPGNNQQVKISELNILYWNLGCSLLKLLET